LSSFAAGGGSASVLSLLVFAFAFAFLVVIPKGDLLLFVAVAFFFFIFCPKIACQAPQPPKPLSHNNIRLHVSSAPTAIIERVEKKTESPAQRPGLFRFKAKEMKTLQRAHNDCKDFMPHRKTKSKAKIPAMRTLHTFDRGGGATVTIENRANHA
jgi:hypothetical protein